MTDILHRISNQFLARQIYQAILSASGLSKWWTKEVRTTSQVVLLNSVLVLRLQKCPLINLYSTNALSGPDEWINTHLFFDLTAERNNTILRFGQKDWKSASDFYCHCNTKWSYFLHSLKSYIETGQGTPFLDDVKI
ncbi:MAG: hypothetical protein HY015_01370 [Bacteroidetes bacterium]|nr:hypothetical protein [Bacteroidota bacterium]MBI3481626.1 hypothetical protein [Bacteroidota bacterium]